MRPHPKALSPLSHAEEEEEEEQGEAQPQALQQPSRDDKPHARARRPGVGLDEVLHAVDLAARPGRLRHLSLLPRIRITWFGLLGFAIRISGVRRAEFCSCDERVLFMRGFCSCHEALRDGGGLVIIAMRLD